MGEEEAERDAHRSESEPGGCGPAADACGPLKSSKSTSRNGGFVSFQFQESVAKGAYLGSGFEADA